MHPKLIAENTLQILHTGHYTNTKGHTIDLQPALQKSLEGTQLYTPEDLDRLVKETSFDKQLTTTYEVNNETALDAFRRLYASGEQHVLCLNFASAKNPGGGFINGAVSQEETIARASGLYPGLQKCMAYYDYHRKNPSALYSDHMIYSPDVPVFKYEPGDLMEEPLPLSIITSPAVNAGVVWLQEPELAAQIEPVMHTRTDKVLALAAAHGHETLILGAWGCGVFRNDPKMISALFSRLLKGKYAGCFRHIAFAVKTKNPSMAQAFATISNHSS